MRSGAAVLAAALALSVATEARAAPQSAAEVQAAILFHLAKFVHWPAPLPVGTPFSVCILGQDPFGERIDRMFADKRVDGAPLRVVRLDAVEAALEARCRVLFLGADRAPRVDSLLGRVEGRAMLTIAGLPGFAERGGVFGFVEQEGSVRFDVNLRTARREKLWISAQVLKLAHRVIE